MTKLFVNLFSQFKTQFYFFSKIIRFRRQYHFKNHGTISRIRETESFYRKEISRWTFKLRNEYTWSHEDQKRNHVDRKHVLLPGPQQIQVLTVSSRFLILTLALPYLFYFPLPSPSLPYSLLFPFHPPNLNTSAVENLSMVGDLQRSFTSRPIVSSYFFFCLIFSAFVILALCFLRIPIFFVCLFPCSYMINSAIIIWHCSSALHHNLTCYLPPTVYSVLRFIVQTYF